MLTSVLGRVVAPFDCCPWGGTVGRHVVIDHPQPLYTPEQRVIRDNSPWTMIQGVLAPLQFLICLISAGLVIRFLMTGDGTLAATASVVAKTMVLYVIMVTGAIWEKKVFGCYLFAPAFFWEDAVSMIVIGLHTFYLYGLLTGTVTPHNLALLALLAYGTYAVNAVQFVAKLRAARKMDSRIAQRAGAGDHVLYSLGQQA